MDITVAFNRADKQRYECLRNALETLKVFAEPSLDPDQFEAFTDIKNTLLERYETKNVENLGKGNTGIAE